MFDSMPDTTRPKQRGSKMSLERSRDVSSTPSRISSGTGQGTTIASTPTGRRQAAKQMFDQYGIPSPSASMLPELAPSRMPISEPVPTAETKHIRRKQVSIPRSKRGEATTNNEVVVQKNNPFVIADQIAKAKVAEPQTSTTVVQVSFSPKSILSIQASEGRQEYPSQSREPNNLPVNEPLESPLLLDRIHQQPHGPEIHPIILDGKALPKNLESCSPLVNSSRKSNLGELHASEKNWQAGNHIVLSPHPPTSEIRSDRTDDKWRSGTSTSPNRSPVEKDLSRVIRRVKELGREPSSRTPEQKRGDSGPATPRRVRVSSPPPWLKHPSIKPGSIEGRLKHSDDSATAMMAPEGPLSLPRQQSQQLRQQQSRHQPVTRGSKSTLASIDATKKDQGAAQDISQTDRNAGRSAGRTETMESQVSPTGTAPRRTTATISASSTNVNAREDDRRVGAPPPPPLPVVHQPRYSQWLQDMQKEQEHAEQAATAEIMRRSTRNSTNRTTTTSGPEAGGNYTSASKSASSFNRNRPSEVTDSRKKTRFIGDDTSNGRNEYDDESVNGDDVGDIRGVTIVLHLRGKDDLVITTDLTPGAGDEGDGEP
ncbi:hypothetical protein B0H66DRAFT_590117 [Apodospora peruviana]|uniref:Uncharacterized protein n=1 Tax=Apodospora peruviana TaxID=516989 RepID=A0AAE0M900_9PEZI|nr:hypothetical protein B0H66DRAFT_590117 [Apodospora peruviana]